MPEKAAFLPHTGGKLWKLRVKNVQRGEIKNMQFVETKQFEQKDLLFREKNVSVPAERVTFPALSA